MLERMHAVVQQAFGGPEVLEVSGVIEHLEGVTRFDIGDEVHGMPFSPARPAPTRNT